MAALSYLVVSYGCFEPSQPLGITSGLKKAFIKIYHMVERTDNLNKAEARPEEASEKKKSSHEN